MGEAGFWENPEKAQQTINLTKPLNHLLKPFNDLYAAVEDLKVLFELRRRMRAWPKRPSQPWSRWKSSSAISS
jgi:hypothetical protein